MNQILEIALRAYVGIERNDWDKYLDGITLSYNSTPHTATGFAPSFLLFGYQPPTMLISSSKEENVIRSNELTHDSAGQMIEEFTTYRSRAQEALLIAQIHQRKSYDQGRSLMEFHKGEQVLINPHTLRLFRSEKGRGNKLLPRYDGPFEIMEKISPVAYRLRLPVSYGIHPVINIAHLEKYNESPSEFGDRPIKESNQENFDQLPETEIQEILDKKYLKRGR